AGGGVYVISQAGSNFTPTATFNNVTITGNSAASGGGITACRASAGEDLCLGQSITPTMGAGLMKNSVIANNGGGNCGDNTRFPFTAPQSGGHNVEDADTCGLRGSGDRVNAAAQLGPLAFNGGPTQTHALIFGSGAIDAGDPSGCTDATGAILTSDQRGLTRTVNAACDAGAYEVQQQLGSGSASIA